MNQTSTLLAPGVDALVASRESTVCAARALVVINDGEIYDETAVAQAALSNGRYTRVYAVIPSDAGWGRPSELTGDTFDSITVEHFHDDGMSGRAASIFDDAKPLDIILGTILADLTGQTLAQAEGGRDAHRVALTWAVRQNHAWAGEPAPSSSFQRKAAMAKTAARRRIRSWSSRSGRSISYGPFARFSDWWCAGRDAKRPLPDLVQGERPRHGAESIESATGLPKVTPVAVPDPGTVRFVCGSQTVLRNDGAVGFEPDEAIFLDKESARQALKQLADFLAANPDAQVTLTGNVAHHGSGKGGLDLRRATAVKDLLVEFGVAGSRIKTVGDGWGPYPSKDAGPDPAFDQQNRRVVVAISCG